MSDWDNKPVIPKLPKPRPPVDYIACTGCSDTFHPDEITRRSGWALCIDCASEHTVAADRELTRHLAYATA